MISSIRTKGTFVDQEARDAYAPASLLTKLGAPEREQACSIRNLHHFAMEEHAKGTDRCTQSTRH
jgi:hypothetical protein